MEKKSFTETIGKYRPTGKITLRQIIEDLGENAFPLTILILSIPCVIPIPMPPGYTTIFGVIIFIIALQWFANRETPKLPAWIFNKEIEAVKINTLIDKTEPVLEFIEKFIKPRNQKFFEYKHSNKFLAFYFMLNAIVLAIPIPVGNIFAGSAIVVGALTALEKDGIGLIISGILSFIGVVSTALIALVGWFIIERAIALLF